MTTKRVKILLRPCPEFSEWLLQDNNERNRLLAVLTRRNQIYLMAQCELATGDANIWRITTSCDTFLIKREEKFHVLQACRLSQLKNTEQRNPSDPAEIGNRSSIIMPSNSTVQKPCWTRWILESKLPY